MKSMESILKDEVKKLENIIKTANSRLKTAPKGNLRVRVWQGKVEYYYKEGEEEIERQREEYNLKENNGKIENSDIKGENRNGRYLKKSEKNLAKGIAQRDYDAKVVKRAKERMKAINIFLDEYEKTSLKKIYEKTNPYRRELISASELSDEEYIKQWQSVKYEGKFFEKGDGEIVTEKGERVRSKSEKIIADKLSALKIPYRYECPIILNGGIKVYPDFTILKMPERKEVYLEHLGLMDDENYIESVVYKLNTYEKNEIYVGVNLFLTHETKKNPLNTRALDGFLRTAFCEEQEQKQDPRNCGRNDL